MASLDGHEACAVLGSSRSCWGYQITDEGLIKISSADCVGNLTYILLWGLADITDKGVVHLAQRYDRVWDGLLDTIRQMQLSVDELRRLSSRCHVPEYLDYVYRNSMVHAMSAITEIAAGLETVSTDLEEVLIGPQPLLEDYKALGLYDELQSDGDVDGEFLDEWAWFEENSVDSEEINDRRM